MAREFELADLGGGAHRITMPLPWALDHTHCYALEAPEGWTIIDTGLGTPGTVRRWTEALELLGPVAENKDVFHAHLAGNLDVGAIPCADRQRSVQGQFHVPGSGGLGARG